MDEQEFLQRVANRLGRSSPQTSPPPRDVEGVPAFWRSYTLGAEERMHRFCREWSDLGGEAVMVEDVPGLQGWLRDRLAALRPARVAVWGDSWLQELGLQAVLAPYETVVWGAGQAGVPETAAADVGITGCDAAIADTGTVAVCASPTQGRGVSLLPPTHIVIIPASRLYTRLGEALEALTRGPDMPSAIHFITGPSRSSDIENDLAIGVHGPAAVLAVIVRNL
ncbi:MAG: lactate utilization protein C [Thermoflavifilum sp.]|nr:lactate utilization protein C [Thermoflavifilum sp.]MCL6513709.1 lactate utilization protein C [Alicyclobacillus sp.]